MLEHEYAWEWNSSLQCLSQAESVDFMNVIAEAGYIAGRASGITRSSSPKPVSLFSTSLHPNIPLCDPSEDHVVGGFLLPTKATTRCKPGPENGYRAAPSVDIKNKLRSSYVPRGAECVVRFNEPNLPVPSIETLPSTLRTLHSHREEQIAQAAASHDLIAWLEDVQHAVSLDPAWICWPSLGCTGQFAISTKACIDKVVASMCGQQSSQPWQHYVLGFIATPTAFGLLKADPCGIEECTFDKRSGRGVIEVIRLCLGLVLANECQLGKNPIFTLQTTWRFSPSIPDPVTGLKRPSSESAGAAGTPYKKFRFDSGPPQPMRKGLVISSTVPARGYRSREICLIQLNDSRLIPSTSTETTTRLYVHYLAYDSTPNNWFGRCTRVFCVSRQMPDEVKKGYIGENPDIFKEIPPEKLKALSFYDGRFALKIIYTDVESEAFAEDLEQRASEAGVKEILFPEMKWKGVQVLEDIRGWTGPPFEDIRASQTERQELISLAPFKRTLNQFIDLREVLFALRDVAKGVKRLADLGLLHQDVSPWNILLADDRLNRTEYREVKDALFIRRVHGPQNGGLLIDLDMAGKLRAPVVRNPLEELEQAAVGEIVAGVPKVIQTGTVPFMSLSVLDATLPHTALDDIQSIFYVLYLLFFTSDGSASSLYPDAAPVEQIHWPDSINAWMHLSNAHRAEKDHFFNGRFQDTGFPFLNTIRAEVLPCWRPQVEELTRIMKTLYKTLWEPATPEPGFKVSRNPAQIDAFIKALGDLAEAETAGSPG
ncbi:hypothetical protein B0H19DRAFT_1136384 [Mycena capillaripes]|nr:hypothetical protein B0H19DRAFT_1136384 [Mycena capillaripes]